MCQVLRDSHKGSRTAVRCMRREAMLLSLMEHPGVITALGVGEHGHEIVCGVLGRSDEEFAGLLADGVLA